MQSPHDYLLYRGYEECHNEPYPSRHNKVNMGVALNQDCFSLEYILKTAPDIDFEEKMLKFLFDNGVKVPKIMAKDEKTLMIEFLRGGTLSEALREREKNGGDFSDIAAALKDWLVSFHKVCGSFPDGEITSAGDLSLTNFTFVSEGFVYRYDFEKEDYTGSFSDDLHTLAAEILMEPCGEEYKKAAAKALLGGDYDKEKLSGALSRLGGETGLADLG